MSRSESVENQDIKQVMRTALVGLQPADQVMLKGYLRVLLRLEADLEWVPATNKQVDLFIINNEFRSAPSIIKLLNDKPSSSVLYVRRSEHGEGLLSGDLLVLPLKQLRELQEWLFRNLPFLQNGAKRRQPVSDEELSVDTSHEKTPVQPSKPNISAQPKPKTNSLTDAKERASSVISFLDTLQSRPEGIYELSNHSGKIASVDLVRQRIWLNNDGIIKPDGFWKLQPAQETSTLDVAQSADLFQWLWTQAWHAPDDLLPLISDEQQYQLLHWPKPRMNSSRSELMQLLTALESQPLKVHEIARKAGTSVNSAKKAVAGLLFAGGLQADNYKQFKEFIVNGKLYKSTSIPKPDDSAAASKPKPKLSILEQMLARRAAGEKRELSSTIDLSTAYKQQPEPEVMKEEAITEEVVQTAKTEKQGFLARLRRKLGL